MRIAHPVSRYEQLTPDDLERVVGDRPVAYWPLGLLEHHGWHLPIGFDGIKAERLCERLAARTGGVLLPVMWWGADGGHGPFLWTHYQDAAAFQQIAAATVRQLFRFGFQAAVLLAGHYPLRPLLDRCLAPVAEEFPDRLLLWGTEMEIGGPDLRFRGDHAAREETSLGLELLPELVRMEALRPGRGAGAWPGGVRPEGVPEIVCLDPAEPLFSQAGADARLATAGHGREIVDPLVERLAALIEERLRQCGGRSDR